MADPNPMFDLHVRHVHRVLGLAFRRYNENMVRPLVAEFWRDSDERLERKGRDGFPPEVEAVRQLEVQRREMMRRVPMIGQLVEAHAAVRRSLDDLSSRVEAIESSAYGTIMEAIVDEVPTSYEPGKDPYR